MVLLSKPVSENDKQRVISNVKKKFVKETFESGLLWNSFKSNPKWISFPEMKKYATQNKEDVYFYNERSHNLYLLDFDTVIRYVELFPYWYQEIDALVFDSEMEWIIAITHEDVILSIGI